MRAATFTWLLVTLGLSACGGGGGGSETAGTPRTYTRTASAVSATPNLSGGWTATQTITLSNDDGGATRGVVGVSDPAGSIGTAASGSGYQVQVALRADAPSEQEARDAIATMGVTHSDSLGSGTLYLATRVYFSQQQQNNVNRSADVTASLPTALSYRLHEDAGAGSVDSSAINGTYALLQTGAGSASLSGTWDSAEVDSGSGSVTVSGDVADLKASAPVGDVTDTIPGTRNATALLDSDVGSVDATVGHAAGTVFDLTATTQVGSASIVVAGTNPVGSQTNEHKHYQSPGFAGGAPKVRVTGRTSVGGVSIHE